MNEETTKLIQQLADKLGTTAEHLWAVLVRQAPITSCVDVVVLIAAVIATVISARTLMKGVKGLKDGFENDGLNMSMAIVGSIVCLIAAIVLIICIAGLGTTASGFLNPEYWALKQIIK
jgi:Flp pilus assembly pilin Flp